jgi:hypothetical protein
MQACLLAQGAIAEGYCAAVGGFSAACHRAGQTPEPLAKSALDVRSLWVSAGETRSGAAVWIGFPGFACAQPRLGFELGRGAAYVIRKRSKSC